MPALLLLFGGLKSFGSFLLKNWKIVLIVLALLGAWYGIAKYGESRYQAGVSDTIASIKKQVATQNVTNRDIEQKTATAVTNFGQQTSAADDKRHDAEQPYIADLDKHLPDVPASNPNQCDVPGSAVLDINAIRALGPKGE